MHRPLPTIFLSYLSGLITGYYINLPRPFLLPLILTVTALYIFTVIIRKTRLSFLLIIIIFILLGILYLNLILSPQLPLNHISYHLPNQRTVLEGVLYKPPELSIDKTKLFVQAEKIIKKALDTVKCVPDSKIKKSRGALFTYLVKKYASQQKTKNPGD